MRTFAFILIAFEHFILLRLASCNFKLQILHMNDLHARFDETDVYCGSCPDNYRAENKCYGGFARIKTAVSRTIEEAKRLNISSIFLNAGDTFQGTPYYSIYKWKIAAALFDDLHFDLMTLGNHEFDDGIENLVAFIKNVSTPVVVCNLNLSSEPRMNLTQITPSKVLTINDVKIGVLGYITPDTMMISDTENLRILPEIPAVREAARRLKSQGVDIIIALSHSGMNFDATLAQEVEEISLIIGGHSHTFLHSPIDKPPSTEEATYAYPYVVTQKSGKKVPIVQAYAFAKYLGKLMVTFDDEGTVIEARGNPVLLDGSIPQDPELAEKVDSWTRLIRPKLRSIVGYTRVFLSRSNFTNGEFESNFANLITDAFLDTAVRKANKSKSALWTNSPIAAYQNGGIRASFDQNKNGGKIPISGGISTEDVLTALPFGNTLYECQIRGSSLKEAMEYSVSLYDQKNLFKPLSYYLHFAGVKIVYDISKPPGNRVESALILCANCSVPSYESLNEEKIYSIVLNNFLMKGGDGFDMFEKRINQRKLGVTEADSMTSFIEKLGVVYPAIEGRVIVKGYENYSCSSKITPTGSVIAALACYISIISRHLVI